MTQDWALIHLKLKLSYLDINYSLFKALWLQYGLWQICKYKLEFSTIKVKNKTRLIFWIFTYARLITQNWTLARLHTN